MDIFASSKLRKYLIETCEDMQQRFKDDPRLSTVPIYVPELKRKLENSQNIPNTLESRFLYVTTMMKADSDNVQSTVDDVSTLLSQRYFDLRDEYVKNFEESYEAIRCFLMGDIDLNALKKILSKFESSANCF